MATIRLSKECRWVGAHVSAAKGLQNAVFNCMKIKGNAFALFLKSQRKWSSPPLDPTIVEKFKKACCDYKFNPENILPHGSYLINLGNPDSEKREKSYDAFLDDLKRCEQLNIKYYNFHPGSTVGQCKPIESIKNIAACINRAH
ncbi:Endodeoxyribonuclease IV domain-containing protein, partial [Rozella allomycis CSF55]